MQPLNSAAARFSKGLLRAYLLEMPRVVKRVIVLLVDVFLCLLSVWVAFYLRLDEFVSLTIAGPWAQGFLTATLVSVLIAIPIFTLSGLYRAIFRYSGWPAMLTLGKAVTFYAFPYFSVFTVVGVTDVPRTIGIIQPILLFILVGVSRAIANVWLGGQYQRILRRLDRPVALIYGAGQSGRQLAAAMRDSDVMQIGGFLDDDEKLHGSVLSGYRIYNPKTLPWLVKELKITNVLLALPSITRTRRNQILNQIQNAHVSVRTLPSLTDLAQGLVSINDLQELDIDDLLGRDSVVPNHPLMSKNILGKTVLVTGAGGSIGSELCRQILATRPKKLILIDHSEYALYGLHQELQTSFSSFASDIIPLLASVQDKRRMRQIIFTWRPETVYHAAAYKHVPLVEHNPSEGIKNNVFGTLHTVQAAIEGGVNDFVLVSTDKAVRPTNIMGASKRLAELVLQALARDGGKTTLTMVRFGNVLGSSGSVVPRFKKQIQDGGPITLTHPEVTRFFMTIPEAAQLVIQASALAKGGDVFVLDMGKPVRIIDLARRMTELSGLTIKDDENPYGDIEILVTGLRPGEKLFEELLIGDDPECTDHPKIMRAKEPSFDWHYLRSKLSLLEQALENGKVAEMRSVMLELVRGYLPSSEIVDLVFSEREPCSENTIASANKH